MVEYGLDICGDTIKSFKHNVLGQLSSIPSNKMHNTRLIIVSYLNMAMEMINPCNICNQALIHFNLNF
jgi:hypothetical protein